MSRARLNLALRTARPLHCSCAMNAVRQSGPFDCGPAALAHCLRRLGIDAPYPDARGRIRPSVRGCRLDELADEALRWGLLTVDEVSARERRKREANR